MAENEKKLFLLDGFALVYRAYFAFINNPRVSSKGLNTSAMFGFTNLLYDTIRKHKPSHMAVVFDPQEEKSERSVAFVDYKAHREAMPEDLQKSLPYIAEIIDGFNLPLYIKEGYEADDVVGTLAKEAEKRGFKTYMMTSDKDYGQLVTENTFWYKPGRMKNPDEVLGIEEVCKKFDVNSPAQVIDLLGLMGDSADNIPGIPGVGEKTAIKLLKEFHTVENLLANTAKLSGKLREKVEENAHLAIISKQLATIITDVPIDFDEEAMLVKELNKDKLHALFTELEFRTLSERILGIAVQASAKTSVGAQVSLFDDVADNTTEDNHIVPFKKINDFEHQYFLVNDTNWRKDLLQELLKQTSVCIDTETTSLQALDAEIVGISFCFNPHQAYYIPLPENKEEAKAILAEFNPFFENETIEKVGQNIKYDLTVLKNYDIEIKGNLFDTMIAHYLLQPDLRHNMDFLAETYLKYSPISTTDLIGAKGKNQLSMRQVEIEKVAEYCNEDTDITLQLKNEFAPKLKEIEVEKVFRDVEMPLIPVLQSMEEEGINVDVEFLKEYSAQLHEEMQKAERNVFEQAGEEFNLASPKQLGEVLFEKLKLDPKAKKTKTGQYATGEDVLQKLSSHPIIHDILEYREISKLKSTYAEALPQLIRPESGRIHTSFMQAVAATGRLSSQNPNLQNIPVRTERGKQFRKAFIRKNEEYVLFSADYSQIELRIVAEMSKDPNMMDAFIQGKDIHTATAARVYNVSEESVTKEMRYKAKSVNFGIIYGQGAFGLAENLKISRSEAKELIDNYFIQYPSIKKYMDTQINFAREYGYVQTMLGRKRRLPDIHSNNSMVRGIAERTAINMPIQGTAADMIKVAMIAIYEEMKRLNLRSRMVLQVHDELLFDVHKDEQSQMQHLIITGMQNSFALGNVPIIAEVGVGNNWLEAH